MEVNPNGDPEADSKSISARIHVKNASNLPVRVISVDFTMRYRWSVLFGEATGKDGERYKIHTPAGKVETISDQVLYVTCPPTEELIVSSVAWPLEGKPDDLTARVTIGGGTRVSIDSYRVVDNSGKLWKIFPSDAKKPPKRQGAVFHLVSKVLGMRALAERQFKKKR